MFKLSIDSLYTFSCLVIDYMEPGISVYMYITGVVNAIKRVE